jgi:hypothetical protein
MGTTYLQSLLENKIEAQGHNRIRNFDGEDGPRNSLGKSGQRTEQLMNIPFRISQIALEHSGGETKGYLRSDNVCKRLRTPQMNS